MIEKYKQMKAWPTRRIHVFNNSAADYSLCGSVTQGQSFPYLKALNYFQLIKIHEYDNLNFCQSCLRVAMSEHNEKYHPLRQHYENLMNKKIGIK